MGWKQNIFPNFISKFLHYQYLVVNPSSCLYTIGPLLSYDIIIYSWQNIMRVWALHPWANDGSFKMGKTHRKPEEEMETEH